MQRVARTGLVLGTQRVGRAQAHLLQRPLDVPTELVRFYCRLTGADSRVATAELQDLVRRDLLVQTGTRRWTTYSLSPQAAETPEAKRSITSGRRMTAVDRQEQIVQLIAERGTISARSISEELNIPRATVNYDLRKLIDAGRIERTTDDPKDKRAEYRVVTKP